MQTICHKDLAVCYVAESILKDFIFRDEENGVGGVDLVDTLYESADIIRKRSHPDLVVICVLDQVLIIERLSCHLVDVGSSK